MFYKKDFGRSLILSLILLILILSLFACNKTEEHTQEIVKSIPVSVIPVDRGSIENVTLYTGIIKPKKQAYVVSIIPGKVSKVYFEIGDRVKKGDTLFIVDNKEIESSIKLLEEQLKVAKANVSLAETAVTAAMGSSFASQKLQLESALKSAEYNYTAAVKAFDAATFLYETKMISSLKYYQTKNQFEQAKNALQTASEGYELYISQLSRDVINSSSQQLKQAQASYDAIKIQIDNAREQLKHTNILSPMDGIIAFTDINEGTYISNTTVPYVVVDMDTVQIVISVTEQVINKIDKDQEVTIIIPAASDGTFLGKVTTVNPVIDQNTFTYTVLIDVPNTHNLIKPGMTAKVGILSEKHENSILVPLNSVLTEDAGKYVFIVDDKNKAVKRSVDVGISNNELVEITNGLESGELLVVKGQQFLKHNHPITISGEGSK